MWFRLANDGCPAVVVCVENTVCIEDFFDLTEHLYVLNTVIEYSAFSDGAQRLKLFLKKLHGFHEVANDVKACRTFMVLKRDQVAMADAFELYRSFKVGALFEHLFELLFTV